MVDTLNNRPKVHEVKANIPSRGFDLPLADAEVTRLRFYRSLSAVDRVTLADKHRSNRGLVDVWHKGLYMRRYPEDQIRVVNKLLLLSLEEK